MPITNSAVCLIRHTAKTHNKANLKWDEDILLKYIRVWTDIVQLHNTANRITIKAKKNYGQLLPLKTSTKIYVLKSLNFFKNAVLYKMPSVSKGRVRWCGYYRDKTHFLTTAQQQ